MRFPIFIELNRSRLFLSFLLIIHALAVVGILLTPWPFWTRLVLLALPGASFHAAYRQWRQVPAGLILHPGGRLEIRETKEEAIPPRSAVLRSGVMALPMLCVFSWQEETETGHYLSKTLALFPDSAEANSMRHLRVWLRAKGANR